MPLRSKSHKEPKTCPTTHCNLPFLGNMVANTLHSQNVLRVSSRHAADTLRYIAGTPKHTEDTSKTRSRYSLKTLWEALDGERRKCKNSLEREKINIFRSCLEGSVNILSDRVRLGGRVISARQSSLESAHLGSG